MYLRYAGDCGYSALNKSGRNEKEHEFRLSNGQADVYPDNMIVERTLGVQVLFEYFETGKRSNNIEWHCNGNE